MKGKRIKKETSKFKKFLLIYIISLLILMGAFLIYVADSLIQYERNQTENFIESSMQEIKKVCKKGNIEKHIDISKIKKSEFEKQNVTVNEGIEELLETQDITYKVNSESKDEKLIYDIYANDRLVFTIELDGSKKENRLGILTFNKWRNEKIINKMEDSICSCNILVPNNYKVYVNGKEVTQDLIKEKVQNEGLTQISKYEEIPYIVKYEIPNLFIEPEVKILDENGNNSEYEKNENTITKQLEITKIDNKDEALKQIKNAPDVLKIAKDWSLYLTDDLAGALNGYYNISKYLIKDSDIAKFAYNWATGVDITFISRHSLMNPIFTNEKVEKFEIYNENAFSCEVYLEKNMRVLSKKLVDKMHERMYFVYDNNSSQWKLVNMQSITENQ